MTFYPPARAGFPAVCHQIRSSNAFREVAADIKNTMDAIGQMRAEMDAQDAGGRSRPIRRYPGPPDPSRSDAPIFEKVCSLTEEEDKQYSDAYERLRKMLDKVNFWDTSPMRATGSQISWF